MISRKIYLKDKNISYSNDCVNLFWSDMFSASRDSLAVTQAAGGGALHALHTELAHVRVSYHVVRIIVHFLLSLEAGCDHLIIIIQHLGLAQF